MRIIFLTMSFIISGFVYSQQFYQDAKLLANIPQMNTQFGEAVDIHENFAIVGAHFGNKVFIYEKIGGNWEFKTSFTGTTGGGFGRQVAIYDSVAVVGVPDNNVYGSLAGLVYVYRRNATTWVFDQILSPLDISSGDRFGAGVSVYENTIVVGSPYNDFTSSNSGAIYIYEFNGTDWVQIEQLTGTNVQSEELFGFRVDIWDTVIVAGCIESSYFENQAGSAYVFEYTAGNWIETDLIGGNDLEAYDGFSYCVSATNGRIIIGAYQHDDGGINAGCAYIFHKEISGDWMQKAQLVAPGINSSEWYGFTVGISDDLAVMGSDIGHHGEGAFVYHFNGTSWVLLQPIVGLDSEPTDLFGRAVAISGNSIIVGALADEEVGNQTGAAYIFGGQYAALSEIDKQSVSIFPNPSNDFVQFNLTDFSSGTIEIYNAELKLVDQLFFMQPLYQYDVQNYFPGVYYLRIFNEKQEVFQKLVVE
jgi:hypothetical protein